MEKRENKRQRTLNRQELFANVRIGSQNLKLPILDISIGGMGVLVTDGFSLLHEGKNIFIETLEKHGDVIATSIQGTIAYLGTGVPSRAGIDFSPADTPIQAYTELNKRDEKSIKLITEKDEIHRIFEETKKWSRGFGDILMINKHKAIPTEFFYLRPQNNNMVLRIVRISTFRLPFQPKIGTIYPFYLFKGVHVILFTAKILDQVKNIVETSWPEQLQWISRRSVLRYFVTGENPITASILHPINSQQVGVFIWDISIEGMGVEVLNDATPIIEGMHLPIIRIALPTGLIETSGIVRSVRNEDVLEKTQLGIEFTGGSERYQDKILKYILEMDLPSENVLARINQTL
ncbi:MAG: hypothetical protein JW920_08710 [Deltaproteobacteria bacterium]|nr:hypothetical protein [Deltaproteobacteria bacterium]